MPGPICTLPASDPDGVCTARWTARNPGPEDSAASRRKVTVPPEHVERLLLAAWRALPMMPANIRAQVASLLTRKAMLTLAGVAVIWGASQFFGVGEVFDVVAAGLTWVMVGMDAVKGLKGYVKYYEIATHARTDAEITQAARYFADATILIISAIGFGKFAKWMGKGVGRAGEAIGIGEAAAVQLARWQKFIDAIEFEVPRNRGMLWSSIGGFRPAGKLAGEKGLVTLEMSIEKSGFQELMHNEYGLYKDMSPATRNITKEIWTMVSKKYARSLEGRVTGYVHRSTHYAKLDRAAEARLLKEPNLGSLRDVQKMINPDDPVLVSEVQEISAMLMNNSKVTELTLIDVQTGEAFGHLTPEILRSLQRLENRPVDRLSHLGPY